MAEDIPRIIRGERLYRIREAIEGGKELRNFKYLDLKRYLRRILRGGGEEKKILLDHDLTTRSSFFLLFFFKQYHAKSITSNPERNSISSLVRSCRVVGKFGKTANEVETS